MLTQVAASYSDLYRQADSNVHQMFGPGEVGCFRQVAALYSDHYRQVPLYIECLGQGRLAALDRWLHYTVTPIDRFYCAVQDMVAFLLSCSSPLPTLQFIGAVYVYSTGGISLTAPRRMFLDTSDPSKPVIRVPKTAEDECIVLSYFSWDKSELAHTGT